MYSALVDEPVVAVPCAAKVGVGRFVPALLGPMPPSLQEGTQVGMGVNLIAVSESS